MQDSVNKERWKKLIEFPLYSISSCGRLRNDKTGKILKGGLDKYGYPQTVLCVKGKHFTRKIHKLVAMSFIPNPNNKPQINHIDGNKENNNVENLEWATAQENSDHFWEYLDCAEHREKLRKTHQGKGILSENPNAKAVIRIEDGKEYSTIKEASLDVGTSYHHIGEVCKNIRKTAGGYHWKFKEKNNAKHSKC